ncbi:MAG TPA: multiheme c-type cytochrome, partial [Pirellulaceae bacterium]|nr:multiheme c-type cytochrome [Pirellulaceae bacterium]
MSRKSKIKTTTPAFWKRLTARTLAVLIGGGVLVLASGLIFADWYTCLPPETHAQYVGRQSCVACHQQQAKLFADSHHDKAMDIATDATVLGDFNNATLEHFGSTSRMYRDGQRFMIHTEGPDGKPGDFEVKYVFGVAPLQNYMVEFDRPANMPANEISRLQVLRVTWDCTEKKWFYLNPPDVYDKLAPDDDLHWTGIAQRWNTMCADCHSTNVMKNFDAESLRYHTTFSEIDVS